MLSKKQQKIVDFILSGRGEITKKEAVVLIGGNYYCNEAKHVGDVLSRMVKRGILTRVRIGVYKLNQRIVSKSDPYKISPNQISLFEGKEVSSGN